MQPSTIKRPAPGPVRAGPRPPAPNGAAPAKQEAGPSSLGEVTRGIVKDAPLRIIMSGVEGVGKSTFAMQAPNPIFIDADNGTEELDVQRLVPKTWGRALKYVDDLTNEEHSYRTVVFDTADALEALCHQQLCEDEGKGSVEKFGYGKGYVEALRYWRILTAKLDALQAKRRMHVIFVAHVVLRTFKNPDHSQGDYDRYFVKMNDKAAGHLKEWSKAVLFANYERVTVEKDGRHRGIDTGKRMLFTRATAVYDAKNRLWLPPEMPLSWAAFIRAVRSGAALREQFADAMSRVDEQTREHAQEWVEQSDYDPAALSQAIEALKAKANGADTRPVTENSKEESAQ